MCVIVIVVQVLHKQVIIEQYLAFYGAQGCEGLSGFRKFLEFLALGLRVLGVYSSRSSRSFWGHVCWSWLYVSPPPPPI